MHYGWIKVPFPFIGSFRKQLRPSEWYDGLRLVALNVDFIAEREYNIIGYRDAIFSFHQNCIFR
jgi:hypothetical protein